MTSPSLFYREIPLTRGQVTIVDAADYDWLMQFHWIAQECSKSKGTFYAVRNVNDSGWRTRKRRQMQCDIMGVPRGVDHKNHDTLDNRRENLRVCSPREQTYNRRLSSRNTSGYKGIRIARSKRYVAGIRVMGKQIYLGTFDTKREAALAYNRAALQYHGEFACLNEID